MPEFDHYNGSHAWAISLQQMWTNVKKCGGPITNNLTSETHKNIPTPDIAKLVKESEGTVLGFYQIRKIQRSSSFSNTFFDIDILLVAPKSWSEHERKDAAKTLHEMQRDPETVKCCMVSQVQRFMHGYARWIYYQGSEKTAVPEFPFYIWEGGSSGGYSRLSGFGRFIDAW